MTATDWQESSVDIEGVTIRYRTRGEGPVIVFVHGVYVGGALWDDLAERLDGVRCVVPTWPLGAHRDPAPHADLSARALAGRIPKFLEALDLHDVTLVGNDTGGGLCLASLASGHPGLERVGKLVLTNCDSYEHFPPKGFDTIASIARKAPVVVQLMLRFFASRPGRRMFLKSVCKNPPVGDRANRIFEAFLTSSAARRDAVRTTASLEPSVTLEAVDDLKTFDKPVLLAWGDSDKLFPLTHAERLKGDFLNARLEVISGSSTYVMLDRPDELASILGSFALGSASDLP
jgi:pimeloyl-ACP methyl ester carboxylesterase